MGKLTNREMVLFGMLGAMTFAGKYALLALPNVEPVSLMVMLFAVVFGKKWVYPVYLYIIMEFLFFGFGLWNINYMYIWAVLALSAKRLKNMEQPLGWALLSGIFGLTFGAMCGILDVFVGGFGYAVVKWISGIPFDIVHCVGNFAFALVLFKPLRGLLEALYARLER